MTNAIHSQQTVSEGIHIPYAYSYANAAARTGATGFVAGDVGKFARQTDDNSIWMLTATTPTWLMISGPGAVVQVAQTAKTNTFTATAASSWTDITGLSVSITPRSTSNKIRVQAMITGGGVAAPRYRLLRGATPIGIADAASNRERATAGDWFTTDQPGTTHIDFLDSPATTSSTTYKIQISGTTGAGNVYINRQAADTDNTDYANARYISTITVTEVAA